MTKGQEFSPESLENLVGRCRLQIQIFPILSIIWTNVPFSWHHNIDEWWNLRCVGPPWSPKMAGWVVKLGKFGANPMRETSPPHFVRCFLVEFLLGSLSTFNNGQSLSEQNSRHVLVCFIYTTSFHSYNGLSTKPMPIPFQLSLWDSEKWSNLPWGRQPVSYPETHICPAEENHWMEWGEGTKLEKRGPWNPR